jgi:hypothetical protein
MSRDKYGTAQQRYEKYYFLVVAVGAVVVVSAPWMFGWPQILLGGGRDGHCAFSDVE